MFLRRTKRKIKQLADVFEKNEKKNKTCEQAKFTTEYPFNTELFTTTTEKLLPLFS